ncbi:MAG: heavy-metal-associated domain-containing protein [Sphingobacteriaceae bacterium]
MEILKLKTDIKCGGCIAAVTPHLNKLSAIEKWEVDTQSPDKILTIQANDNIDSQQIIDILKTAGYKAEKV